jgi:acyl dehydratase
VNFDTSLLGHTIRSEEFRVNTVRLAQFAAAANDTNAQHREGRIAPPVFANVPVMQATIEALHKVTTAFAFHGEHDFRFHQPIRPGMRLYSSAQLAGVQMTGAGVSIVIKTETHTDQQQCLNEQYFTALVAKESIPKPAGTAAPEHRVPDSITAQPPIASATAPLDADQTRRYADAARDYSDYTMSAEAARAKGLEAPLVHGMLTLAIAGGAVVEHACGADSARLNRLACRFSGPLYLMPGQALTTRIWRLDRRDGREGYAFESRDTGGRVVLKHGVAEVAA